MRDELIGKHVGGYEILGLIGHGGMATVYSAQQKSMNRTVAIKVLPRQFMNDDTYMQRFNREVKIVSTLEHRNIVPVYDYGEHEGQPYIVMRFMSGGSVDDLLAEGPLKLDKTANIIEQIAPALDYAHTKQVLHRDLKPSNVLMDDDGGAYLTDFGIARILGEPNNTNITTQGVVGTPSYMSPEQAQGQPLDGRSDVYSLGVMLFEMATGRRPFESDTPYSIAVMQVTTQPPAPRSYNPSIPAQVESVIYRVMEKQAVKRYPDAGALSTALKQAVNGQLVSVDDTQPGFPRPQTPSPAPVRSAAPYVPPLSPPQPQAQVAPRSYPQQPQYTPPRGPSATSGQIAASFRHRRLPVRKNNFWMNVAIGGLIGCGLLTVIVIVIALLLGGFPDAAGAIFALSVPTATAELSDFPSSAILNQGNGSVGGDGGIRSTLDPTSEAARRRLLSSTNTVSEAGVAPAVDDLEILATSQPTERPITLQEAASQAGTAMAEAVPAATGVLGVGEREPTLTPIPAPVQTAFSSGGLAFFDDRDGNFELYLLDLDSETAQ
ncbi:MAG: protein kinase, partial [Burkholderiales bacterium]|nr:protein kinase [Anaerolineae bacterium]